MERLRAVAARILRDGEGCPELFEILAAGACVTGTAGDLSLPSGLAIAPASAARCILDETRTVAFLRGVRGALREARRRFPGSVLELVYAGTGPFAPLAIPLMALAEVPRVRFTLIDIHRESVHAVGRLLSSFGLHADVVLGDATTYTHPTAIHVVVTETMQQSLKTEPLVAIVRNLRRQLAPGGLLVPSRVSVSVARVEGGDGRRSVFEIGAGGESAQPAIVTLQPGRVALYTEIEVFDGIVLSDFASGLTVPEILWPLSGTRDSMDVAFRYVPGAKPGIRYENVSCAGDHGAEDRASGAAASASSVTARTNSEVCTESLLPS